MKCTKCNCPTAVIETRRMGSSRPKTSYKFSVPVSRHKTGRIRKCRACGHKFETTEEPLSTVTEHYKMTEIVQLTAPAIVGRIVKSLTSETEFIVERIDASGVHSSIDRNGVGLWLEHGNYRIV